jgi:hypothetical protein
MTQSPLRNIGDDDGVERSARISPWKSELRFRDVERKARKAMSAFGRAFSRLGLFVQRHQQRQCLASSPVEERRARGGPAMGGEGDLKAAPGGARARRTARPRSARGFYLLSSHISPVWPVNYVWRAVAQRAAAAGGRGDGPALQHY